MTKEYEERLSIYTTIQNDIETALIKHIPRPLLPFINTKKLSSKILDAVDGWLG